MLPNVYPYWASKGTKCKLVVAPRGALAPWAMKKSWFKKKIFGWMFQNAVLRNADMFHATSEKEYEEIRALGYKQPVAIVPIGMDISQGNSSVDKKDQNRIRRIVFFGRIHKVKAIDNLVNAWGDLYQLLPQWELVIAGPDCGAKMDLERLIKDRRIPRVRFVGELNGQAKYDFLGNADIYVLPSHTENFGVTVAEALASGVPVIASQGTPWEGLEKEKCGCWIPIGIEPLKTALKELTALSDEERQVMGERGQDWIRRDFSWEGIGAKMKDAYAWLLGQGDKPDCVRLD
jgi:glycosyltransferase involved in cell wall biosynthesis